MSKPSPFETVHKRMNANFAEYDGWSLPKDFGDPAAEDMALLEGAAAFDLSSFGRITVKRSGRDDLIESVIRVGERPAEGQWTWAGIDEGTEKSLRVGRVKGNYLILTRPGDCEQVAARMNACAKERNITNAFVTDITDKTAMLGLYGPRAVEAVGNILPFDVSGVEQGGITMMTFFMISITIIRGGWTDADGIELICPTSAAALAAGAVAKYHARENIVAAGMDCLLKNI